MVPYRDVRSPLTDLGLSTSAILGLGRSGLTQVVCLRVLGLAVARTVCNCVPQMRKLVHWGIRRFTLDLERVTSVWHRIGCRRYARAESRHTISITSTVATLRARREMPMVATECQVTECHRVPMAACHRVPPSAIDLPMGLPPSAYGHATECHPAYKRGGMAHAICHHRSSSGRGAHTAARPMARSLQHSSSDSDAFSIGKTRSRGVGVRGGSRSPWARAQPAKARRWERR